ncbi:MAG: hypothetical protein ABSH48_02960 [Verrucomicrobiota bacterium]
MAATPKISAQGASISYQGRLSESGSPANTNFDFRFAVFNAPTNGTLVSGWLTNSDVPVSNGLFTVALDFGVGVFNGTDNGSNDWLDVSVRAGGGAGFTELTPRQPILPVPYALFATSASNLLGSLSAPQLVGTVSSLQISGAYSNAVNFVNGSNTFAGTFSGNGAALTNLNASAIASGTLADARLEADVALLDANQTYSGTDTHNGAVVFNAGTTFNGTNAFTGPNSFAAANTFGGVNTFANNGNYFIGSFFGNGLVGWTPVYGSSTNAMRDAGYLTLNAGFSAVTLPASSSLSVDDIVRVSGGGGGGWQVKENSGQSIVGNFACYRNCVLASMSQSPTSDGYGVAASADGVRMYAVGGDLIGVYASSDFGQTWSQVSGTQLSGYWSSVACSANGMIVYAAPISGAIQMSTNGGVTWSSTGQSAAGGFISCTANGSTLLTGSVACSGNGTYRARLSGGSLQFSANSGGSWTTISTAPANLFCLGASSDCTRMVAGVSNGLLYASSNLGATWTTLTTGNQFWSGAWMSPDGARFAATVIQSGGTEGGIFSCAVSALPNTSNTNSTIVGSQGSAVELQYLGNGQFMPVGFTGLLWAN